jgi:hypothetical protein
MCSHLHKNDKGVCNRCKQKTCSINVEYCFCAVGWPYELQCVECRDMPNRMDDQYCCCVPLTHPDRHEVKLSMAQMAEGPIPMARTGT